MAQRVDILGYQVSPVQRWLRNDNGYRARRRFKAPCRALPAGASSA